MLALICKASFSFSWIITHVQFARLAPVNNTADSRTRKVARKIQVISLNFCNKGSDHIFLTNRKDKATSNWSFPLICLESKWIKANWTAHIDILLTDYNMLIYTTKRFMKHSQPFSISIYYAANKGSRQTTCQGNHSIS